MPDDDVKVKAFPTPSPMPEPKPTPPPPPTVARVVMHGRRPWVVGETIGLSRGYTFTPGSPVEVTAADAKILMGREWDGRRFVRVDDD